MTQAPIATHDVLNQSPPFEDIDFFAADAPLVAAVAANGGAPASAELSDFGKHLGSAVMAERGRVANENKPKLRSLHCTCKCCDEDAVQPGLRFRGYLA